MVFNSFHFLIFFVACLVIHFSIPHHRRWMFLLPASYYFYMCWNPPFVLLLWATTLLDYGFARGIAASSDRRVRKTLVTLSIIASASVLFAFKYLDFTIVSLNQVIAHFNLFAPLPLFKLILPVGISFYTFQSLSYIIDVYRGATPVEKHLGVFALYVVFFPQLVAGPIERSNNLLPQMYRRPRLEYDRVSSGLAIALWGLFKKMCVADLLAPAVETVYHNPSQYSGPILLLATLFFAVQIYCDFSGYSDIAIGVARIMGYDLMTNFAQPYFASSIPDFWRRWHISLSTWFRDYVYYPLGGNRVAGMKWVRNILIVFLVSGMWHGANWTFIVWGLIHALLMLAWTPFLKREGGPAINLIWQIPLTFFFVLISWVFFRAQNLADAFHILSHFHRVAGFSSASLFLLGLPRFEIALSFVVIFILFMVDYCLRFRPAPVLGIWKRRPVRWFVYASAVYFIVFFGVFERVQFIYFQF